MLTLCLHNNFIIRKYTPLCPIYTQCFDPLNKNWNCILKVNAVSCNLGFFINVYYLQKAVYY